MNARIKKKLLIGGACGAVALALSIGSFFLFSKREAASAIVSVGLQQFADEAYFAASAPSGEQICFSPEWFDAALLGGAVSAVTVTALPPVTEGRLLLGHSEVSVGQTISRELLSLLTFEAAEGVSESGFDFLPSTLSGEASYTLHCRLCTKSEGNRAPTTGNAVTAVSTHQALTLSGTLMAKDADGDAVRYEILHYPANGTLFLDTVSGSFTYEPLNGFVGHDSFVFRAQDLLGQYSDAQTVQITVRERPVDYLFSDVASDSLQSAALRVTEKGLMGGEANGGKHYFYPKRALNRAAFVAILLEAAEIKAPEAESTGFADDAEIPMGMKGAIRYAREQGWLGNEEYFRPNAPITRAEAASIAAKVLSLSTPGYHETVEDFSSIPVDVADALYAIYEEGYITTMADGTLSPLGELTRGDAARFFAAILDQKA